MTTLDAEIDALIAEDDRRREDDDRRAREWYASLSAQDRARADHVRETVLAAVLARLTAFVEPTVESMRRFLERRLAGGSP